METKDSYSAAILPIVRKVRDILLPYYGKVEFREKRGAYDLVTDLDVSIEEFYKKEFAAAYPDIAFVGEETGGDKGAAQFWLVDPIDGTSHFIRGLPFCTSQLALIKNGEVAFSVVYDFVNDIVYSAEKGRGAFANHSAIRVSDRALSGARLATVFDLWQDSYFREYLRIKKYAHTFHVGASGYELAQIAAGRLDGAVYRTEQSQDYDVAPGVFLIKEAGGVAANIGLHAYDYRNRHFIAANSRIFKELTEGPDAIFPIEQ